MTSHFILSNVTVHPALHKGRIPINDAMARCGTMCPVSIVGRPGIAISHLCVDWTTVPSGRFIFSGVFDNRLLSTSTPSMMKMDVAPVSAMAWSVAMVIAAATSGRTTGRFFDRFDAITVSSSCMLHIRFMVGSEEGRAAETKCLNLFAIPFSAPHRQVYAGSTFLCIPFVLGLYPAVIYCCAFARLNPSW